MSRRIGGTFSAAAVAGVLALVGRVLADDASSAQAAARSILAGAGVTGGLVVYVGCGDPDGPALAAALGAGEGFLVHALEADDRHVEAARRHVQALKLYGKVSVDRWDGTALPYVDNLVNLVVVAEGARAPVAEVMRVLRPGGTACVRHEGTWVKTVKPRPAEIDEWTHFLHDAGGNAVARDARVGPPRHMQWQAEPLWCRNHHTLASISAVVSAGGRVFYIVDEGPASAIAAPARWSLVARDAFNGVLLWQRPIASWAWHRHRFRSGPVQLPRTLAAAGDRVYVPLGLDAPVSALDAATGKTVRVYKSTAPAEEIILADGVLLAVRGEPVTEQALGDPDAPKGRFPNAKSIAAVRAESGEALWNWSEPQDARLMPLTLAAEGERVFLQAGRQVLCLDRATGRELWRSPGPAAPADETPRKGRGKGKAAPGRGAGWSVATLVAHNGVVLWADGQRLQAMSADKGQALWTCPCRPSMRSPVDVLVIDGLVWVGPDFAEGLDLRTGEAKKRNVAATRLWTAGHHPRCYRNKATSRYILTGKRGVEFFDLLSDGHSRNNWVRGACQYGVMPCNGLLYAPSHACGCYMEAKLYGFWALAHQRQEAKAAAGGDGSRFRQGPAYGEAAPAGETAGDDWRTYRHDGRRSGAAAADVDLPLGEVWSADVGGRPSPLVVAGGRVFVSAIDAHRVVALDAGSGRAHWSFTAGGRVDSPPTVDGGRVLFGCADGWVYCLRAADGAEAWRFRAAPADRRTVALGRVESVWPVHGSVLVQHGVAYVCAGRCSYLDGGIRLYGLDPQTGKVLHESCLASDHAGAGSAERAAPAKIVQNATDDKTFAAPDRSDAFSMAGGGTTDVLVGDGAAVYMRHLRFDSRLAREEESGRHLFSTSRLLDDAEVHRSHWVLGTGNFSRIPVAYSWIVNRGGGWGSRIAVPYGLLLAFDDQTVWAAQRRDPYVLVARHLPPLTAEKDGQPDFTKDTAPKPAAPKWSVGLSLRPRAMVRAGKRLFLGGMPAAARKRDESPPPPAPGGGLLLALSAEDGATLGKWPLKQPPVWDGLAAAGGRLYVAATDGKVACFGKRR